MKFELVATCLFGLEHLLGEEIDALGYERTKTIDGRVTFLGDCEAVAYANVFLRYAERVYIKLGEFKADTFDALFEGTRALPWELWIGKSDAFPVKGHSISSTLFSIPDCQKIVKRAVVQRLSDTYGVKWFEETGKKYQIEFFILKDTATLMIDTSGVPLHKRGYRTEANAAPIRETLAAAIAATSRPREEVLLWDPMCGSGTIAIEGAMLINNIAPGKNRSFASEGFAQIERKHWQNAREQARDEEKHTSFEAFASDIDSGVLDLARENARRAGVERHIKIFRADALSINKKTTGDVSRRGTVICNPPYGERMGERSEAEALYRKMGAPFRALAPWQIYILTSSENFQRLYGARADKVKRLYNGMIPCYLYQYFKPKN
jgi:putative N6-adenine-specific DNA methylase